ncbi:MAG: UvrD-helicase domain-containing protein [Planctomycetota bacterium]
MDAFTEGLTEAQAQAVRHIDGPLLILAGPGSGKTRVVTHRIANLLHHGIAGHRILAVTFTNKAADEMRSRLDQLVPGQQVAMGTFHKICARLLRQHASMVGLSENYSIYDTGDAKQALKRAIASAGVSTSHMSPEQIAASISRAKNRLISPEMMQQSQRRAGDTVAAKVYPVYQQQLMQANAVDFDDLLMHVALLLRQNPDLRADLDARFRYILVDEYQDTNLAQYAIVRALSIDHPNLAVTGDSDQSIYGWRGADLNNILDFEKDYPKVNVVRLEQNYRSTPEILRVADQLIRHNRYRKKKDLFTDNASGDMVVMHEFENGYREADAIADEITSQLNAGAARASDFAVFCRINALTRSVEHALRARMIPYQIINGVEFYQRKEIKDLLAYLHLINNPAHDVAFQRVVNTPTRGIGATTLKRIEAYADANGLTLLQAAKQAREIDTLSKRAVTMVGKFVSLYDGLCRKATATLEDLLRYVVEETEYERFLEKHAPDEQDAAPMANVDELISAAVEYDRRHPDDGSVESFLEEVALVSDTDAFESETDRVTLMTLHAAKGLEFPRVFVIGLEDGLLPHQRSKETEQQIEEERRLLFVGITRAQKWLQLSYCKQRSVRGDLRPAVPSLFLQELPRDEMLVVSAQQRNGYFDGDAWADSYPDSWDAIDESPDDLPSIDVGEDRVEEAASDYRAPRTAGKEASEEPEPAATPEPLAIIPEVYQRPSKTPAKRPSAAIRQAKSGLKTATEVLDEGYTPLGAFREGCVVEHPEYGEGEILTLTGRGPKRIAKIRFDHQEETILLAYAKLRLKVEG